MNKPSMQNTLGSGGGRVALVTGAAGIIGPAIVKKLRSEGWVVAATDRDPEMFALYEKAFGEPLCTDDCFHADLVSCGECEQLVRDVEARLGPIGGVVNNAVINPAAGLGEIEEETANKAFAVNFFAPLWIVQAALPSLQRQEGAVVNISSILVDEIRASNLLYASSKAALEKATEIMALECREVRFNTVRVGRVPGYHFMQAALERLSPAHARRMVKQLMPERIAEMNKHLGPSLVGTPEDVAHSVAFLMAPESRFINGHTLVITGGPMDAHKQQNGGTQIDLQARVSEWIAANTLEETQDAACSSSK